MRFVPFSLESIRAVLRGVGHRAHAGWCLQTTLETQGTVAEGISACTKTGKQKQCTANAPGATSSCFEVCLEVFSLNKSLGPPLSTPGLCHLCPPALTLPGG